MESVEKYNFNQIKEQLKNIFPNMEIPIIDESVNFWTIRSIKGAFYEEFISNKYIAVGYNYIDKTTDLKSDVLPEALINIHPFVKQSTKAINKCNYFINSMKENDIVIVIGKETSEITIALIGEYFEEDIDPDTENTVFTKIKISRAKVRDVKCPYKKRRKIKPIRTMKTNGINPHLYRTLRNYNGIDDINEHADLILGLIYNVFMYKEIIHIGIEVRQEENIKLAAISGFLYGTSTYFEDMTEEKNVHAKVNACSVGSTEILIEKGWEFLSAYGPEAIIGFAAIILLGYMATKIDIPKFVKEIVCLPTSIKEEKEQKKLVTESMRLDNKNKEMDLKIKEQEYNKRMENEKSSIAKEILAGTSEPLKLQFIKKDVDAINALSNIERKYDKKK